jgi:hypothetical protein
MSLTLILSSPLCTGKSTLIKLLVQETEPDEGTGGEVIAILQPTIDTTQLLGCCLAALSHAAVNLQALSLHCI